MTLYLRGVPLLDRLMLQMEPDPNSGCWLWTAHVNAGGYGKTSLNRKSLLAHRASWTVFRGEIPPGMDVLHRCDTPPCINPDHLYLGTDIENSADRVARGRSSHDTGSPGEKNGHAKLTEARVIVIRELHLQGWSVGAIAQSFGISRSQTHRIITYQRWAYLRKPQEKAA